MTSKKMKIEKNEPY